MTLITLPPKNISENRQDQTPQTMHTASSRVNHYLSSTLGNEYIGGAVSHSSTTSSALIRCNRDGLPARCFVGRVYVDSQTGCPIPLTPEQIREIRECADWYAARMRGELARDDRGYVSQHQSRRLASQWLDRHLSMKFYASGGIFFPLQEPLWQYSIAFKLRHLHLEPLGLIEVDALTGDVEPISHERLQMIKERVHAVIRDQKSSTVA